MGVSVVIPCYNSARYLGSAVDSVLGQGYDGPIEILVVDDGSNDGSLELARLLGPPTIVLQHPGGINRGVSASRNLGIRYARHTMVAFLDADDLWLPGHLASLTKEFASNPSAGIAYDNARYSDEHGRIFGDRLGQHHRALGPSELFLDCCIHMSSVLVRRSVFEDVGLFDENLMYSEDHDMWLRILEQFYSIYVPIYGSVYRIHDHQATIHPQWELCLLVLAKAVARYPYPRNVVRKRRAVIEYRLGQGALSEAKWSEALFRYAYAALLDPLRAVNELGQRTMSWFERLRNNPKTSL